MNLKEKAAIVTGGSRGIGKAIAIKLAQCGANVTINYSSDAAAAESAAAEIKALGRECVAVQADVSSSEDVSRLFDSAVSAFGKVDILVNNAGITKDRLLLRMTDEDWDKVIAVNLRSVFLCTRAAVKLMMRQRWGRIINMSSIVGVGGNAGQANYAAAKAGIIGFTKAVAKEVGSRGITVNALAPGFIETQMTDGLDESVKKKILERIPSAVLGTPQDVAEAVAFLAAEESKYITGQVIGIDGGMGGI